MKKEKVRFLLVDPTSIHHGPPQEIEEYDSFINKKYVDKINEVVTNLIPDNQNQALHSQYISNYGLLMLSSLLKKDYEHIDYINGDYFSSSNDFINYLSSKINEYDFMFLSATTPQFNETKRIAIMAKEINPKIKTFFGGPHSRYYLNHDVDSFFDCVAIGYGIDKSKEAVDKLVCEEKIDKKIITNYYYDIEKDFSLIPDKKLKDTMLYSYINFGCPNDCKYCVEHKFVDKIEFNKLDSKFNEIKQLVNNFNVKFVHIADSDFLIHRKTVEEFIKFVKKENLKFCFSINTSPQVINKYLDDSIIYDLKETGLVEVLIGAEHFSEKVLRALSKKYDIAKFAESLNFIKNVAEIPVVSLYTLVGLPGEYAEEITENLNIIRKFKDKNLFDFTFPKFFVPYPDSDIYLHPEKYDVIIKNENWEEYQRWQLPRPIIIKGASDQQYVDEIVEINKISMEDYKNENNRGRSYCKKRW